MSIQHIRCKLDTKCVEKALAKAVADIDRESKLSDEEREALKERRIAVLKANLEKNKFLL